MNPLQVLAIVPNVREFSPGQRTGIELWEKVLEPAGIHLHYLPFETDRLHSVLYKRGYMKTKITEMIRAYIRRMNDLRNLDDYDAVYVFREAALIGPAFFEKWIARRGKPMIYHFDDPIYIRYRSPINGRWSYLKCLGKTATICKMSRIVIVNSRHHEDYAAQYNANVWRIPCLVDADKYSFNPETQDSFPVCVGWSGSPTTVGNMQVVVDAMRELAKRVNHKVHLIGGEEFNLPGIAYTAQPWRAKTEVEDLRKIQIGMVPLPVNEWNKRKFYMKVVQYMALGIPPVCTPMGSNPEVIKHGVTGFLADGTREWVEYLELLIRDKSRRLEMSHNAAQEARAKYSLQANAKTIVAAFYSAAQ